VKKLHAVGYVVKVDGDNPFLAGECIYVDDKWSFADVVVWETKAKAQKRCNQPHHKVVKVRVTEL